MESETRAPELEERITGGANYAAQLHSLEQGPAETLAAYVARARQLRNLYLSAGGTMPEEDATIFMLYGLRKEHALDGKFLLADPSMRPLTFARALVQLAGNRCSLALDVPAASLNCKTAASRGPAETSTSARVAEVQALAVNQPLKCHYCDGAGHIARNCRKKKKDELDGKFLLANPSPRVRPLTCARRLEGNRCSLALDVPAGSASLDCKTAASRGPAESSASAPVAEEQALSMDQPLKCHYCDCTGHKARCCRKKKKDELDGKFLLANPSVRPLTFARRLEGNRCLLALDVPAASSDCKTAASCSPAESAASAPVAEMQAVAVDQPLKCYYCDGAGHIARFCRKKKKDAMLRMAGGGVFGNGSGQNPNGTQGAPSRLGRQYALAIDYPDEDEVEDDNYRGAYAV